MASNLQTSSEPSLTSIMAGIIHDFQELIKQQLTLFKVEVAADLRKTREALASLVAGLAALFVGSGLLCLMLVHLLAAFTVLPLWACYLVVGGGILLLGALLTGVAWQQFQSITPVQSVDALKENLEWKTKPN